MDHNKLKFRALNSYKYQLTENLIVNSNICPENNIETEFIELSKSGILIIKKGYAWDGASGPTWDDETNIIPSCIHDAFYQLLREGHLPQEYRDKVDFLFYSLLLNNGMSRARAWYYWKAVSLFGKNYARPKTPNIPK